MYWLMAQFLIKSMSDIKFLQETYYGVNGELSLCNKENTEIFLSVEWCDNPFEVLSNRIDLSYYPFNVVARLVGPATIKAVSLKIEKVDVDKFEHPNKAVILQWVNHIDNDVGREMYRENDGSIVFKKPEQPLANMSEVTLAVKLAKNITHVIPFKKSYIVANTKSVYLSQIGLNSDVTPALQFDIDDGFISSFGDYDSESKDLQYINSRFQLWKLNGYRGKLVDYFETFD